MHCATGHCGHCQLGPLLLCRDGPVVGYDRVAQLFLWSCDMATDPGLVTDPRPTLAVWKFASCDGCQLTLLDCEDELLGLTERVRIDHFLEMTPVEGAGGERARPDGRGPLRPLPGRRVDHHRRGRRADPAHPQHLQVSGDHRSLRHRGRHPGTAQLRRRRRVPCRGLRPARVHLHAGDLDTDLGARPVRFRTAQLPSTAASC